MEINHHVVQALKARNIMKRDVDYIVRDGEIIIVDEFTGRFMFGRRYSNGLHQAIEAKEKVMAVSYTHLEAGYFRMFIFFGLCCVLAVVLSMTLARRVKTLKAAKEAGEKA